MLKRGLGLGQPLTTAEGISRWNMQIGMVGTASKTPLKPVFAGACSGWMVCKVKVTAWVGYSLNYVSKAAVAARWLFCTEG